MFLPSAYIYSIVDRVQSRLHNTRHFVHSYFHIEYIIQVETADATGTVECIWTKDNIELDIKKCIESNKYYQISIYRGNTDKTRVFE